MKIHQDVKRSFKVNISSVLSSEYFPFDSQCKSIHNLELVFHIIEYCNNTLILKQF